MDDRITEMDYLFEFLRQGRINDELLPQQIKTFRTGSRDAHLMQPYHIVGQVDRLFAGSQYVEYGGILFGVISIKALGVRVVFFPGALDAALNALNFTDDDVIHTA
jgi:hypothetical protein